MTDEEVEVVAEELAKIGGTSWYPGREPGPLLKVVTDRYRERARVAIAALDRFNASSCFRDNAIDGTHGFNKDPQRLRWNEVRQGATVIYRPAGDRRAYPCRVVEIRGGRAYLAPIVRTCTGWVSIENLLPGRAKLTSAND